MYKYHYVTSIFIFNVLKRRLNLCFHLIVPKTCAILLGPTINTEETTHCDKCFTEKNLWDCAKFLQVVTSVGIYSWHNGNFSQRSTFSLNFMLNKGNTTKKIFIFHILSLMDKTLAPVSDPLVLCKIYKKLLLCKICIKMKGNF